MTAFTAAEIDEIVALSRKMYEHNRKILQKADGDIALTALTAATQMLLCAAAEAYGMDVAKVLNKFCAHLRQFDPADLLEEQLNGSTRH